MCEQMKNNVNYYIQNVSVCNYFKSKLLSENKLIICVFGNMHYQISREKFEPESGLELRPLAQW